jgi:hypothetical protein
MAIMLPSASPAKALGHVHISVACSLYSCLARESGHPGAANSASNARVSLGPRFRGDDEGKMKQAGRG